MSIGVVSGARPARLLARSLARSRFKLFLYLGNPSFCRVSRRSRLRLLAGKVRAAEMRVNFDHGCSGEREKSDYGLVDTKRDCFRRARLPTRFLGTMNRISSVSRRSSSNPAVMTPTLMVCVISRYRINFSNENCRYFIIYCYEKDITASYGRSII